MRLIGNVFFKHIKKIHDDGCIEGNRNTIAYFLIEARDIGEDKTNRVKVLMKLINSISGKYAIDIYIQNAVEDTSLTDRYAGIKLKGDIQENKIFVDLMDYNQKYLKEKSLYTCLIYVIKAKDSELKTMRRIVESIIKDSEETVLPALMIADKPNVIGIINKVMDTDHVYKETEELKEENTIERGFMVRHE